MPATVHAVDEIDMGNLTTTGTRVFEVHTKQDFSVFVNLDVNTPAAATFTSASEVDATLNTFTDSVVGTYTTGLKGQVSTTVALPTGLLAVTDYFVIKLAGNVMQLAASLADALAGTAINITDVGTGNQTFTPTALAGGATKVQKSNKGAVLARNYTYAAADWTDIAAATNFTGDDTFWYEKNDPTYLALCVHVTLTAGQVNPIIRWDSRYRSWM